MYIKIHAHPGEKSEKVVKNSEDSYDVHVREKAENGAANRQISAIVRNIFPHRKVIMIAGHRSSHKIFVIDD